MNDEWPNEQDAALMQQEWDAEQQAYADIARMTEEWQTRWPNHCRACGGWGASPIRHYHYMEPPDGGDPCEALPEGRCHRCGCELTQPDDPRELGTCKTCCWRFDDGAPSL